jgi:hypothetical protein
MSGHGNYKVQDVNTCRIYVSRDVTFEEGLPHRTSASVGEQIPLFEADAPLAKHGLESNPEPDREIPDNHNIDHSVDQNIQVLDMDQGTINQGRPLTTIPVDPR